MANEHKPYHKVQILEFISIAKIFLGVFLAVLVSLVAWCGTNVLGDSGIDAQSPSNNLVLGVFSSLAAVVLILLVICEILWTYIAKLSEAKE